MDRRTFLAALGGALLVPAACVSKPATIQATAPALPFVERGKGPLIVLVHGGMQDYRFWDAVTPPLAAAHRVVAYSRRNHWPGPVALDGAPDGAAPLHADDLAAFLTALNAGPARIVAHSSGAHAALICAARRPDLIAALAVNEPAAGGVLADVPGGPALAAAFGASLQPARDAFKAGDYGTGMRLFADAVGGPGEYERRNAAVKAMMRDNVLAQAGDAVTKPMPGLTPDMARTIAAPALITCGERSPQFFHAVADHLAACIPHAARLDIAGSSHTVPDEKPAEFAAAVLKFFAAA